MTGRYAALPVAPHDYPMPCDACSGRGVAEGYLLFPGDTFTLVVDVICPECGGCGNADPDHHGCPRDAHADFGEYGPDYEDEDDGEQEMPCYLCRTGRGWWSCQAFDEHTVVDVRVPCGCSESRLLYADDVDELLKLVAAHLAGAS